MGRDDTLHRTKYKGHPANCTCDRCKRTRRTQNASTSDAWKQFEHGRVEEKSKRRESRLRRNMHKRDKMD